MWVAGVPDTLSPEKLWTADHDLDLTEEGAFQALLTQLDVSRMPRRSPRLGEIAELAALLASGNAHSVTGSFVNATGMFTS